MKNFRRSCSRGTALVLVDFESGWPRSVTSSMSPEQSGFSHLPVLGRMTAHLAARERIGLADVQGTRASSLSVQNASARSHRCWYSATRSLNAISPRQVRLRSTSLLGR
jgi:hypothetical protein